jgi:hypothetical protein
VTTHLHLLAVREVDYTTSRATRMLLRYVVLTVAANLLQGAEPKAPEVPPVNAPARAMGEDVDMESPGSSAFTETFNATAGVSTTMPLTLVPCC